MIKNILQRKSFYHLILILVVSILVLVFCIEAWKAYYPATYIKELEQEWQYSADGNNYTPVTLPNRIKDFPAGSALYLKTTLTDVYPFPALLLKGEHQKITAAIDSQVIFDSDQVYPTNTKNPGLYLPIVYLPDNYLDKELVITISSPYPFFQGAINNIYIGRNSSLVGFGLTRCTFSIVLSMFSFLLGVFFIILFIFNLSSNHNDNISSANKINIFLSFFCLTACFFYTAHSQIIHMFYNALQLSFIVLFSLYILKIPLFLLMFQIVKNKLVYLSILLTNIFWLTALLLRFTTTIDLPALFPYYLVLAFFTSLTVLVSLLHEARGNTFARPYLFIFSLFFIFEMLFIWHYYNTGINTSSVYMQIGLMIFLCGSFYLQIVQLIRNKSDMIINNNMLALKSDLAIKQLDLMKNNNHEILAIKHDINNNLAILNVLLLDKEYDKAISYLENLNSLHMTTKQIVNTNNYLVNIILNDRIAKAASLNIRIETDIKIPANLNIPEKDLSSILTNLLDNSIEACSQLTAPEDKIIKFACRTKNNFLYISVWNPKANTIFLRDSEIITTKSAPQSHGFGLKIIKKIVDSYNGILDIDYDEASFTVSIVLPYVVIDKDRYKAQ